MTKVTKVWHDLAGLIESKIRRQTGRRVSVYDGILAGIEDDPGCKWCTVCEDHGLICCHETLFLARAHAPYPMGWCEDCYAPKGLER